MTSMPPPAASQSEKSEMGQIFFADKSIPTISCQTISNEYVDRTPAPPKRAPSHVSFTENHEQVQRPKSNNNGDNKQNNYILDDEEDDEPHHMVQRSKRVLQQLGDNEKNGLNHIAALTVKETATMLNIDIRPHRLAKGRAWANLSL